MVRSEKKETAPTAAVTRGRVTLPDCARGAKREKGNAPTAAVTRGRVTLPDCARGGKREKGNAPTAAVTRGRATLPDCAREVRSEEKGIATSAAVARERDPPVPHRFKASWYLPDRVKSSFGFSFYHEISRRCCRAARRSLCRGVRFSPSRFMRGCGPSSRASASGASG